MSIQDADPSPDLANLSLTSRPHTESTTQSHRSHDPSKNLKRSDPFKFGSRYLAPTDDVFEFNAWDHVTPDADFYTYADAQYAFQSAHPVSEFDQKRFNTSPEKWWNRFYSNNTSNFFKDRKWLQQEFPILGEIAKRAAGKKVVLEVGAGAGNTAFPILKWNENDELIIHAVDFSSQAVSLIQSSPQYDPSHIHASVWDVASTSSLPEGIEEGSVDVVLMVFVFSALNPEQWERAVGNVWRCLREGGEVCFRDYGKGDLTQVRFKRERLLGGRFYVRGDGTRVYFFEEEEVRAIWEGEDARSGRRSDHKDRGESLVNGGGDVAPLAPASNDETNEESMAASTAETNERSNECVTMSKQAFEIVSLGVDRRMLVNRQKQLKMYRCWIQGRFRKPHAVTPS